MGVGFIGLCNIGGRCARNVLAAVTSRRLLPSTVADLDDSVCPRLVGTGTGAATDPHQSSQRPQTLPIEFSSLT